MLGAMQAFDKILAEIAGNPKHVYFDTLRTNEPTLDWLSWAARVYRTSHSANTICAYAQHVCKFRDMLSQETLSDFEVLTNFIDIAKGNEQMILKTLDDFVTFCDSACMYSPSVTRNSFNAIIGVLKNFNIKLDKDEIENITLPKVSQLNDEYPSNETIRTIVSTCAKHGTIIGPFVMLLCDTGFEPIDASQLRVKDLRLDEEPVRIMKKREKTNQPLEGWLSKSTVEALKPFIENKKPDEYIFVKHWRQFSADTLRCRYNYYCAKAGFGEVAGKMHSHVEKIEGHKFGKLHLKVYKKRWFTQAITSGVPEYVAQGMLGRKQYLDQYMRLPIEQKREFAKKILAKVSIYETTQDTQAVKQGVAQLLGLNEINEDQLKQLQAMMRGMLRLPANEQMRLIKEGMREETGNA